VPKKAGYNIRPLTRRTSSERDAWLAEMRHAVAQKGMFDPTEADILEMRAAIGDNGAFAKFSKANETLLFSVMLTLRRNSKSTASASGPNRSEPLRSCPCSPNCLRPTTS
jgi:hypothetical protein